jgi:hypothetical protein
MQAMTDDEDVAVREGNRKLRMLRGPVVELWEKPATT